MDCFATVILVQLRLAKSKTIFNSRSPSAFPGEGALHFLPPFRVTHVHTKRVITNITVFSAPENVSSAFGLLGSSVAIRIHSGSPTGATVTSAFYNSTTISGLSYRGTLHGVCSEGTPFVNPQCALTSLWLDAYPMALQSSGTYWIEFEITADRGASVSMPTICPETFDPFASDDDPTNGNAVYWGSSDWENVANSRNQLGVLFGICGYYDS